MSRFSIKLTLLTLLIATQISFAQQASRTIFLVRHAEAESTAPTAALTPAGEKRSQCLAHTLADAGIKQIYVSDAKRTQQTAAPLASQLKLTPSIIAGADVSTLVRNLLYGTGNVLVVGHSNTLPVIIQRLQAGNVGAIGEKEFDKLFVVSVMEGAGSPAATLRYCEASAPTPTAAPPKAKP